MLISYVKVGEEHEWLVKHKAKFQRLADQGNQDFAGLMKELSEREDFKDIWDSRYIVLDIIELYCQDML